jgi:hypothetical protein
MNTRKRKFSHLVIDTSLHEDEDAACAGVTELFASPLPSGIYNFSTPKTLVSTSLTPTERLLWCDEDGDCTENVANYCGAIDTDRYRAKYSSGWTYKEWGSGFHLSDAAKTLTMEKQFQQCRQTLEILGKRNRQRRNLNQSDSIFEMILDIATRRSNPWMDKALFLQRYKIPTKRSTVFRHHCIFADSRRPFICPTRTQAIDVRFKPVPGQATFVFQCRLNLVHYTVMKHLLKEEQFLM